MNTQADLNGPKSPLITWSFAISTLIIALGFTQVPITPENLGRGPIWGDVLVWVIAVAPLLPALAALIRLRVSAPLPKKVVIALAVLTGAFGILVSLLNAALSGVGTGLALMHGLSLTIAVVGSILLLSSQTMKIAVVLTVPVAVAIWSLASVAAVTLQANNISSGRPFCLAPHSPNSDTQSFAQLRGLTFYSTSSGYKSTSRWYFHGVLLVETEGEIEAYNWSPRRLAFRRIEQPQKFIATPLTTCTPQREFWDTLSAL
ncbi:MAG: hypothetical protein ABJL99_27285 [Aliishimia sp.]